jgi:hypothetical protein
MTGTDNGALWRITTRLDRVMGPIRPPTPAPWTTPTLVTDLRAPQQDRLPGTRLAASATIAPASHPRSSVIEHKFVDGEPSTSITCRRETAAPTVPT